MSKKILLLGALGLASAAGLAATAGLLMSRTYRNENSTESGLYKNYVESKELYNKNKNDFIFDQTTQANLSYLEKLADDSWKEPKLGLTNVLENTNNYQSALLTAYLDYAKNNTLTFNELKLLKKVLENQQNRIRENDLFDNFKSEKLTQPNTLGQLNTRTKDQIYNFLQQFADKLNKYLNQQNDIIQSTLYPVSPLANTFEENIYFSQTLPTIVLQNYFNIYINKIKDQLLANNFSKNEIVLNKNSLDNLTNQYKEDNIDLRITHQEIFEIINQIQEATKSNVLDKYYAIKTQEYVKDIKNQVSAATSLNEFKDIKSQLNVYLTMLLDNSRSMPELRNNLKSFVVHALNGTNYLKSLIYNALKRNYFEHNINISYDKLDDVNEEYKDQFIGFKNKLATEIALITNLDKKIVKLNTILNSRFTDSIITYERKDFYQKEINNFISSISQNTKDLNNKLDKVIDSLTKEIEKRVALNNLTKELKINQELNRSTFMSNEIATIYSNLLNQAVELQANQKINSDELVTKTDLLEAQFRSNQKTYFHLLFAKVDQIKNELKTQNENEFSDIIEELETLNEIHEKYVNYFNPLPSPLLTTIIKRYDAKLNAITLFIEYHKTKTNADNTSIYLDKVYNPNQEENFEYNSYTKKQIDLNNQLNDQLAQLKNKIDAGIASQADLKKFDEINDKLNSLRENAIELNKLANLGVELDEILASAENSPTLKQKVAEKQDEIDALKKQLEELFNDPFANKDKIAQTQKELSVLLNNLNDDQTDIAFANELQNALDAINNNYGDEEGEQSLGESSLRNKWNELKDKVAQLGNLSDEQKDELLDEIIKLKNAAPIVKNLEINKQQLLNQIDEVENSPYSMAKTQNAIDQAEETIANVDQIIKNVFVGDQIPALTTISVQEANLNDAKDDLTLASSKDKLAYFNTFLQAKSSTESDEIDNKLNEALTKIDQETEKLQASNDPENVKNMSNVVEKQIPLVDALKEAIAKQKELTENNPKTTAYLKAQIEKNLPLPTDTETIVAQKIANIKKVMQIADEKKLLENQILALDNVLTDAQEPKAIFSDVLTNINTLKNKYKNMLDDTTNKYSIDEIKAAQNDINENRNQLEATRDKNQTNYDAAVANIDQIKTNIDQSITGIKNVDPNASFPNYDRVVIEYEQYKISNPATIEGINNFENKLKVAYAKDLALEQLRKIREYVNDPEFGNSNSHLQVKNSAEEFINDLTQRLNNPSLNETQAKELLAKAEQEFSLVVEQKRTADKISTIENTTDPVEREAQKTTLEKLTQALNNSLPNSTNNYSDLIQRKEELKKQLANESTLSEIRSRNAENIEDARIGLRNKFREKLAAIPGGVDPEAEELINSKLDELLKTNSAATTMDPLNEISQKIDNIALNLDKTVELAAKVKLANDALTTAENNSSPAVIEYRTQLNNLIVQAKNNYASNTNNGSDLDQISNQITELTNKLNLATEIENIIREAKAILATTNFNSKNSINGNTSYRVNVDRWLDRIQTNTINSSGTQDQAHLLRMKERALKAKELVTKENEIATQIEDYQRDSYLGVLTDANYLINALWNNIPTKSYDNDANNVEINDNIDRLINALNVAKSTATKRKENHVIFENYKQDLNDDTYENLNTSFQEVYLKLKTRLDKYEEDNTSAASFDELNTLVEDFKTWLKNPTTNYLDLAKTIKSAEEYANTLGSDYQLRDEKNELKTLIANAELLYTQKVTPEQIDVKKVEIQIKHEKLKLLNTYAELRNKLNSNNILIDDEKEVLNAKFEEFIRELNQGEQSIRNFEVLKNKYLDKTNENTSIPNIYENAVELRKYINSGQNYLTYKAIGINTYLDSDTTRTKYDDLNTLLIQAENANKNLNNNEADKVLKQFEIITAINEIIESKKIDLNKTKTRAQNLLNIINEKYSNLKLPEFEEKAITELTNQEFSNYQLDEETSAVEKINAKLTAAINQLNLQISKIYNEGLEVKRNNVLSTWNYLKNNFQAFNARGNANEVVTNINSTERDKYVDSAFAWKINKTVENENDKNTWLNIVNSIYTTDNSDKTFNSLYEALYAGSYFLSKFEKANFNNSLIINYVKVDATRDFATDFLLPFTQNFNTIDTFSNDFIAQMYNLQNNLVKNIDKDQLETAINVDYTSLDNYLNDSELINKIVEAFKPLTLATMDDDNSYLDNNYLSSLQEEFNNNLKIQIEKAREDLTTRLTSIESYKNLDNLLLFGKNLSKVNQTYTSFYETFKDLIKKLISQKLSLQEIFSELYLNEQFASPSQFTNELVNNYNQKLDELINIIGLEKNGNNLVETTEKLYSNNKENFVTVINNLFTNNQESKWTKFMKFVVENKSQFLKQLNSPVTNEGGFTKDHRYEVVRAKDDVLLRHFTTYLNSLDTNLTELDITNNDTFLDMFKAFAFTKIDIPNASQPSTYNQNFFKVVLLKNQTETDSSWYTPENSGSEAFRQIKVKVKYIYQPQNTPSFDNIGEFSEEKELTIKFYTTDTVGLEDGASDLFFNQNLDAGFLARIPILDLQDAGWESVTTQEEAERKIIAAIKEQVLNGQNSVVFKPSELKNNPNGKFLFEFQNQLATTLRVNDVSNIGNFIPFTSLLMDNDKQILRVSVNEATNELVFLEALPANFIGTPYFNKALPNSPYNNKEEYDRLVANESIFWELNNPGVFDLQRTMPVSQLNMYRFSFKLENGKIYIYTNWYESSFIIKKRSVRDSNYDRQNVAEEYKPVWTAEKWSEYLMNRADSLVREIDTKNWPRNYFFLPASSSSIREFGLLFPTSIDSRTIIVEGSDPENTLVASKQQHWRGGAGSNGQRIEDISAQQRIGGLYNASSRAFNFKIRTRPNID